MFEMGKFKVKFDVACYLNVPLFFKVHFQILRNKKEIFKLRKNFKIWNLSHYIVFFIHSYQRNPDWLGKRHFRPLYPKSLLGSICAQSQRPKKFKIFNFQLYIIKRLMD